MPTNEGKQTIKIIGKIYDQMLKAAEESEQEKPKNIVLYVGKIYEPIVNEIREYSKKTAKALRVGLIYDSKAKLDDKLQVLLEKLDILIPCNLNSPSSLQKNLLPYQNEILAVTCRAEDRIDSFAKVVPHLPYLPAPTAESLLWASNKLLMRKRLFIYNKNITPAFAIIHDYNQSTLKKIEEEVGFPLIVKPAGLAASRLVSICYHKEELLGVLKKCFRKINALNKDAGNPTDNPIFIVERFLEGEMYSIDGYVDSKGKTVFCPMVSVKTGKNIGFDDFFGYQQMTPTLLHKDSIAKAEFVAGTAVQALALKNTAVHIEMMKTEAGWKIIELGARVGGFRNSMYQYSYNINHTINDIKIHIPEKPLTPKKVLGYTVAMKFFAKQEGILSKLTGIKKIQELKSFKEIDIHKSIGDPCLYAKNGGSSVFNLIMFNQERSKLLADIRRVENMVEIETKSKTKLINNNKISG